jgi:hypothetical protein
LDRLFPCLFSWPFPAGHTVDFFSHDALPLPGAGTIIIGQLAVKERGRGIYPVAEVFSFDFHRLENITRDEPINLA